MNTSFFVGIKRNMVDFNIFDLSHSKAGEYLSAFPLPWVALDGIANLVESIGQGLVKSEYDQILPSVWVHKSAKIDDSATFVGPCVVGAETEVRKSAFIRGSALIGDGCVVGNSTEIKNAILFDGVQVPHFNYIGDSILGYKAHFGAGAITSNLKGDKSTVSIGNNRVRYFTGMRKVGAFVGDHVEVGCHAVLNPGTLIGQNTIIYPLSSVRGIVPPNCIYKNKGDIVERENR